jgi:hypothetical protein
MVCLSREMDVDRDRATALNRICAYFTMFPLRFPYGILARSAEERQRVLDPFCGRGTTNYAARLRGLDSVGIDVSPVAAAIAEAKMVDATPAETTSAYSALLESVPFADPPEGEFWRWAFGPRTLKTICRLRQALLEECSTAAQKAVRGILLGALHGPVAKEPSYLSNQAPRTFSPKPDYSVSFWRERRLKPDERDVEKVVSSRAERYYANERTKPLGRILHADSRDPPAGLGTFDWVISSPPYYGMRTYVPDQWLRNWFLGGSDTPDYSAKGQLSHNSPDAFADDLRRVWAWTAEVARPAARLVVRFGGINDRKAEPLDVLKASLCDSGWRISTIRSAGTAAKGRRQALSFASGQAPPRDEYDLWATLAERA